MKRISLLIFAAAIAGCSSTGSSTSVGELTTFPEISDAADNVTVKVFYTMTGAKVWTAKDSLVKINYQNSYTNQYLGFIDTRGDQRLNVEIEPLEVSGAAAAVP